MTFLGWVKLIFCRHDWHASPFRALDSKGVSYQCWKCRIWRHDD